jgi:hypothetical protein
MQWIIDLLIDKLKKDNNENQWEPEPLPLWIDEYYPSAVDKDDDNDNVDKTIVIDL